MWATTGPVCPAPYNACILVYYHSVIAFPHPSHTSVLAGGSIFLDEDDDAQTHETRPWLNLRFLGLELPHWAYLRALDQLAEAQGLVDTATHAQVKNLFWAMTQTVQCSMSVVSLWLFDKLLFCPIVILIHDPVWSFEWLSKLVSFATLLCRHNGKHSVSNPELTASGVTVMVHVLLL